MMKSLGGGSKEGKMRIRAFPVIYILYFSFRLPLEYYCYCFLVCFFLSVDVDGREECGNNLEFTGKFHSANLDEEQGRC